MYIQPTVVCALVRTFDTCEYFLVCTKKLDKCGKHNCIIYDFTLKYYKFLQLSLMFVRCQYVKTIINNHKNDASIVLRLLIIYALNRCNYKCERDLLFQSERSNRIIRVQKPININW